METLLTNNIYKNFMKVTTFKHEIFGELRTVIMPDGQIGFVGKDVARALGYKNASNAILSHVEEEDKMLMMIKTADTQNGDLLNKTKTAVISESGLYSLILSSKKAEAKEFKHWVTSVVLVQIRQTGSYSAEEGQENETISMLRKAVSMYERACEMKDEIIDAQRPKVEFANVVGVDTDLCTLAELAKLICNAGVPIGQNRLCEWMRENHFLGRSRHHWNTPHQEWVDQGLFVVKVYKRPFVCRGYTYEVCPMVTCKGQEYFIQCFAAEQRSAA